MHVEKRSAFGGFLDDLPKALYVVAHMAFFGVGIGLWAHAKTTALPHPGALLLYVVSQVIFFAFFANWITLKMTVLLEQTLMLIMVCAIGFGAL
jgi:uncharacterized membrane protein YhhN